MSELPIPVQAESTLVQPSRLARDEVILEASPAVDLHALAGALAPGRRHLLWKPPAPEVEGFLAVGRALGRTASGPASAVELDRELRADLDRLGGDPASLATVAMAFDPARPFSVQGVSEPAWDAFEAVELTVPEILFRLSPGGRVRVQVQGDERTVADLLMEAEDLVAAAADGVAPWSGLDLSVSWAERRHRVDVLAALEELARNPDLDKVVLAHAVEVVRPEPFDAASLVAALGRRHPDCFAFQIAPEDGGVFCGVSPERLVRRDAGRLASGALAGSAPRCADPARDAAAGRALAASAKDREEHAIVVDMIVEALGPLVYEVEHPDAPELARFANVQHLFTPIEGRPRPGVGLLDAVEALHPTPAVGGMPRDAALAAIRRFERRPRGLYAGVVGWVDGAGHGDTAVAIRSALLHRERALVFAGGGIVRGSVPEVEVEETRVKLDAVLGVMVPPGDRPPHPPRPPRAE
jgi:isochorismate synthase